MNARIPGSPGVGAYWKAEGSPEEMISPSTSARSGPGNVAGSGKPPENEMTSVAPDWARISARPAPWSTRVRAANADAHRPSV